MRPDEIRDLTPADIRTRVTELEEERFRLKFRSATEQLEEPLRLRWIRRDIARLKTILRQKTTGEQAAGAADAAPARPSARKSARKTAKKSARKTAKTPARERARRSAR